MRLIDKKYMKLALELAETACHQTSPNPSVGAIIVNEGEIVGMGAHLKSGEAHAETLALEMAKERAKQATLYVTLEPCSHEGKQAPCTEAIIRSGIKRVVIACLDQNELVNGVKDLQEAGIEVEVGLLEKRARKHYEVFFHTLKHKKPYVTVKTAMSLDGKIATKTGESKWITNEQARQDGRLYRHLNDAILVGSGTVIHDDPQLTTRFRGGRNPLRIVLDTRLRIPLLSQLVQDKRAETWIFTGNQVSPKRKKLFQAQGVKVISCKTEKIDLKMMLNYLYEQGIQTLLVEGGARINGAFLKADLIDQLICYMAPILIGGKTARSSFMGSGHALLSDSLALEIEKVEQLESNLKIIAKKGY